MANYYDAENIPGAEYVVECISREGFPTTHLPVHSEARLSFESAQQFQTVREKQGFDAVIRRW
jgi:hypothetical protein